MRDAARDLLEHGAVPIPVPYRSKAPKDPAWQKTSRESVSLEAFDKRVNIGVLLGEPSAWLVDVDLDCPEAIAAAPYVLQSTKIFGRATAPASHHLYYSRDAQTVKLYDPVMVARKEKKKAMLVELRSTGCQSIVPPSVHELGEAIEYDPSGEDEPIVIGSESLTSDVHVVGAAALFMRYGGLEVEEAIAAARSKHLPDGLPDLVVAAAHGWLGIAAAPKPQAEKPRGRAVDVLERARLYVAKIPGAVSGNGGHDTTYDAALALVCGFDLDESTALTILEEYNQRCEPQWKQHELKHKIHSAATSMKAPRRGYLLEKDKPAKEPRKKVEQTIDDEPVTNIADHRRALRSRSYLTAVSIIRRNARDVLDGRSLELNEMTGKPSLARRQIEDVDLHRVRANIEERFDGSADGMEGIRISVSDVEAALLQVSYENSYHPLRDYLATLTWDGVERLADVAEDILDAEKTAINAAIMRRWFIAAVARAMDPGCKVDTVLILVGGQGAYKSTLLRTLASRDWFTDSGVDIHNKDSFMILRRVWIYEWAELDVLRRARDANSVKAFLSSSVDTYRPPHGRMVIDVPRSCVIVGSTNDDEFLGDATGNRRFWPLRCGRINIATAKEQRDQLWAEALHLYRKGEQWWLTDEETEELNKAHVNHEISDAWETPIETWIASRHLALDPFTTADVLAEALSKPRGQWSRADEMRVSDVLRRTGWKLGNKPKGKARSWVRK
jgi:predicted P-loop ATPase